MVKIFPSLLSSLPAFLSLSTHIWYDFPPSIFQSKFFTSQVLFFGLLALGDERGQFSSAVTQSCLILCEPMDWSTPGFPVHHQLPEFTQTHVCPVGDAIQPLILCCPLLLLPSLFPSIRVFSNESGGKTIRASHQVAKVLEFLL